MDHGGGRAAADTREDEVKASSCGISADLRARMGERRCGYVYVCVYVKHYAASTRAHTRDVRDTTPYNFGAA